MNLRLVLAASIAVSLAAAAAACSSSDTPTPTGTSTTDGGGTVIGTGDTVSGGAGCLIGNGDGGSFECDITRINGKSSVASQADCPAQTTFVAACPTTNLLGCCSKAGGSGGGATNEEETCDYQGFPNINTGNPETAQDIQTFCAQPGVTGAVGRFSTTP